MVSKDKPLIIYIDDDVDMLHVVSNALKHEGFDVMCTSDPEIFFEYFKLHDVELVIVDAEMPEKTGFELSEELRSKPDYPNVPIIFLSGHNSEGDKLKGYFSGATEYLGKPVSNKHLIATINKLLCLD